MKCRGRQVRGQIVEEYRVIPKAHIKLLADRQKEVMQKQILLMNTIYLRL